MFTSLGRMLQPLLIPRNILGLQEASLKARWPRQVALAGWGVISAGLKWSQEIRLWRRELLPRNKGVRIWAFVPSAFSSQLQQLLKKKKSASNTAPFWWIFSITVLVILLCGKHALVHLSISPCMFTLSHFIWTLCHTTFFFFFFRNNFKPLVIHCNLGLALCVTSKLRNRKEH